MNIDAKLYLIDKQSNDGIVHQSRLGKTDGFMKTM
jgi:hypothetical protein